MGGIKNFDSRSVDEQDDRAGSTQKLEKDTSSKMENTQKVDQKNEIKKLPTAQKHSKSQRDLAISLLRTSFVIRANDHPFEL